MKSQTISRIKNSSGGNCGFSISEIMIAFSMLTLLLVSAISLSITMESLHAKAVEHLENLETAVAEISAPDDIVPTQYGNDTYEIKAGPLTLLKSDYENAWGRDSCPVEIFSNPENINLQNLLLYAQGIDMGQGIGTSNPSTDIEVRHGIAYITADSTTASMPDFFIIDMANPSSPFILSALNTGPGLSSIEVAGHYAYVANISTVSQLQVIDIANRQAPVIVALLKLPLPENVPNAPHATTLFYNKGKIYLGTEKWAGNEFSVIDVGTPTSPQYLGGFETNTLINNIYIRDGLAYVAASDIGQMRILDVSNPVSISQITSFSPSGWQTQQGKIITYFEGRLSLGRTVGGINNTNNHEIILFSTESPIYMEKSHDIPGGVYGIVLRPDYLYLSTKSAGHEFQVWDSGLSHIIFEKSLVFLPTAMTCDGKSIYFATGNQKGIAVMSLL